MSHNPEDREVERHEHNYKVAHEYHESKKQEKSEHKKKAIKKTLEKGKEMSYREKLHKAGKTAKGWDEFVKNNKNFR